MIGWRWSRRPSPRRERSLGCTSWRCGGLHPVSAGSLRAALLTRGDLDLHPVDVFSEDELDWAHPAALEHRAPTLPSAQDVFRMLRNAGERGLLAQFPAAIVGLPKATNLQRHHPTEVRQRYRADQRDAVLSVFARYSPDTMIVADVDIGHTDPQWVLPYGGNLTIDGPNRRISAHY